MYNFKQRAIDLRKSGKTYSEIASLIPKVSKSTLSYWLRGVELSHFQKEKIAKSISVKLARARLKSLAVRKKKRQKYFINIENKNAHLLDILNKNPYASKLVLAALYLGEGSKTSRGALRLGNSDPGVVRLFLGLLKRCYTIEEPRFRCTVLCRADQNIKKLERFWANVTGISRRQFYKTRVDPRTIGKPSRKVDYRGVCVIDYLSANVYYDLLTLGRMISK
ncbi:MAG TPA: hypothetical protein VG941_01590 [Candidatus Paceibacterota bacterium]|nr:hypothetical protein [Candidatus Paceibacterota bacterium]